MHQLSNEWPFQHALHLVVHVLRYPENLLPAYISYPFISKTPLNAHQTPSQCIDLSFTHEPEVSPFHLPSRDSLNRQKPILDQPIQIPWTSTTQLPLCITFPLRFPQPLPNRRIILTPPLHPLQLILDLLPLKRYLVALLGRGPETLDREARVEVRAEVVHPAYWEEDVHPELWAVRIRFEVFEEG